MYNIKSCSSIHAHGKPSCPYPRLQVVIVQCAARVEPLAPAVIFVGQKQAMVSSASRLAELLLDFLAHIVDNQRAVELRSVCRLGCIRKQLSVPCASFALEKLPRHQYVPA